MGKWQRESDAGMTLIEVLASVVVLGLFITVMLSLFAQSSTVSKQTAEKQQAMILAQNALAQEPSVVVNEAVNLESYPKTVNGVNYQVQLTQVKSPPAWVGTGVYVEVTVTWNSFQSGQKVSKSIDLEQLFDNN